MFNDLTGSSQSVGNWPGVTVEKQESRLKDRGDVTIQGLPGIYSLSPYTLEEVVARGYLVNERPDVILNIVDGTSIERNLYLTTQLIELGLPVVVAVNMIDLVHKDGSRIDLDALGKALGCTAVEMSTPKRLGSQEAAAATGGAVCWIFAPLGFGSWQATVATVTGLIAKEEVASTMGVLFPGNLTANVGTAFTAVSAYSFMIFNLLCAPCFAAIGAIKREMNSARWTAGAIGYMCGFAYACALVVYQLGGLALGLVRFNFWTAAAAAALTGMLYLLVRSGYAPNGESQSLRPVASTAP